MHTPDIKKFMQTELADVREFQAIAACETPEFQKKWTELRAFRREMFVSTAETWGLAYWEKILSITPPETDTVEDRRFRVLVRLNERLPYTRRGIIKNLEAICGEGNIRLDVDAEAQTARCFVGLQALSRLAEVEKALGRMMQAHIAYTVEPLFNTHDKLNDLDLTHTDLDDYTHKEVREHYFG